jgi:hypothetical protein
MVVMSQNHTPNGGIVSTSVRKVRK